MATVMTAVVSPEVRLETWLAGSAVQPKTCYAYITAPDDQLPFVGEIFDTHSDVS